MTVFFVTGGAGFIGSSLVDRLLQDDHLVIADDNFSTGQMAFLEQARQSPNFRLVRGDLLDLPAVTEAMAGAEFVCHLAVQTAVPHTAAA